MGPFKVRKGAKIRNRYNQVPHLTQDTNGKVTNSQSDTTNESQKVNFLEIESVLNKAGRYFLESRNSPLVVQAKKFAWTQNYTACSRMVST